MRETTMSEETSERIEDNRLAELLARSPARVLAGRAGPGYRTATWLKLRADHAAARDAVHQKLDVARDLGSLVERFGLFEVRTQAKSKTEYLTRPDLGRRLDDDSAARIQTECPGAIDLQVIVGDGLSATAVATQAPALLPELAEEASAREWSFGRPFAVRYCRVGVLNHIGDLLRPVVAVLLIGERPGLVTAESLSAYLAYSPRSGQTDADRNLVSNIHGRGVAVPNAARRVIALVEALRHARRGGVTVKEVLETSTQELSSTARHS
jgi:ethanolamine ammonia-lyase small subunit